MVEGIESLESLLKQDGQNQIFLLRKVNRNRRKVIDKYRYRTIIQIQNRGIVRVKF